MGICGSSATPEQRVEHNKHSKIEKAYKQAQAKDQMMKKLLLLGTGESGKSTLFRQMISLYGTGFTEDDRREYTYSVMNNTISAIKTLIQYSEHFGHGTNPAIASSIQALTDCKLDVRIDPELAHHIKLVWADMGIQQTWEQRANFQMQDSAAYYFGRVDEISAADYEPTDQDIVHCRIRTTGIVETAFEIEGNPFKMMDVGGQRNERKKWIHCFEEVTAVIFVAAISEYDQKLYEDNTTNRMVESLQVFEETCNSRWFHDTSIILFLNKRDLFMEKIKRVPLTFCFPDYPDDPNDYDAGVAFLRRQFEARNHTARNDKIYTHVTCATDSGNVRHVFNSVKDTIVRQTLRDAGLMNSENMM